MDLREQISEYLIDIEEGKAAEVIEESEFRYLLEEAVFMDYDEWEIGSYQILIRGKYLKDIDTVLINEKEQIEKALVKFAELEKKSVRYISWNPLPKSKSPVNDDSIKDVVDSSSSINPKVFISYAWETEELKEWVRYFAKRLRKNGVDAKLDRWEVVPGDKLPHFMEKSVRENDYVLIICTPTYKSKSDNRVGGVGYEGDIMTGEVHQSSNHRKFIPILKIGTKETALPSWLQGKYFIDFSNAAHFENNYEDLITTLFKARETAPEIGTIPGRFKDNNMKDNYTHPNTANTLDEEIKIKGVLIDEVSMPLNNNTPGSALYVIPFELNRKPNLEWIDFFIAAWNRPKRFSTMHRPGIASVKENKIVLDGTTIEEVEKYHKETLSLAVSTANENYKDLRILKSQREKEEAIRKEKLKNDIASVSERLKFD
jgi:hypothetical protein